MEENAAEGIPKESTDNENKEMPDEEKKKGFFEKIKEKFSKKKQESEEPAAKKGFFERIKEKFKKKEEEKAEQEQKEELRLDDIKEAVEEGFGEDKAQ
jgi:hypothetical protein